MRGKDVKVVVLGDASGVGDNRWVGLLAADLAKDRRVRQVTVSANGQEKTQESGTGDRTVTLRNASDAGLTLRTATARIAQLVPADTDLVIVNFGHRETQESIAADLEELWNRIPASSSAMVVVQNPEKGTGQQAQRERTRAVSDWATTSKVLQVNVFDAFTKAPEPLADLLEKDGVLPNADGSRLWKDEVRKALGG